MYAFKNNVKTSGLVSRMSYASSNCFRNLWDFQPILVDGNQILLADRDGHPCFGIEVIEYVAGRAVESLQ